MWSREMQKLLDEMNKTYNVIIVLNCNDEHCFMDVFHLTDNSITHHELVNGPHTACKTMTAIRKTMRQFR